MHPDPSRILLEYSTMRGRWRWSRWLVWGGVALVLLGALIWWVGSGPRDISTAREPWDGHFVQRDDRGKVIQETVWRKGKLVSAWETTTPSRWVGNQLIIDPPRWTQVVKDGNGNITYFDAQGRDFGFASYIRGDFDRGGH